MTSAQEDHRLWAIESVHEFFASKHWQSSVAPVVNRLKAANVNLNLNLNAELDSVDFCCMPLVSSFRQFSIRGNQ